LTFIAQAGGRPLDAASLGNQFRVHRGLPSKLSLHGLRKAAARRLAEAGCSVHEIGAITGHKTLSEVER
jgi:integrase